MKLKSLNYSKEHKHSNDEAAYTAQLTGSVSRIYKELKKAKHQENK